jgi:hypothetical protein
MLLDEQIVALEGALADAGIPHAFGGAQALAYYGPIRATHDIDLNVFVGIDRAERVLEALARLGVETDAPNLRARIERDEQVRLFWQRTPIDLFFAYDPLHDSSMQRRRKVDFYGDPIHVLSPEDLIVYKATFDRPKDWEDIAGIVFACDLPLDFDYVRGWLEKIDAAPGARLARLEAVIISGGRDLGR